MTVYTKLTHRPLALEGLFEKPKNRLLGQVRDKYYSVYYQSTLSSLMYVDSVSSYQLQIDLKLTTGSLYIHGVDNNNER